MNQEFFRPVMKFRCHFPNLMLETAQSSSSTACATTCHLLQPWGKGLSSKRCRIPLASQITLSKFKHLKSYLYQQTIRPIGAAEVTSDRQRIGQSSNKLLIMLDGEFLRGGNIPKPNIWNFTGIAGHISP
jgi:hypothetical protein